MEPDRERLRLTTPTSQSRARRRPRCAYRAAQLACLFVLAAAACAAEKKPPANFIRAYDCPAQGIVTDMAMAPNERFVAQASVVPQNANGQAGAAQSVRLLEFSRDCPVAAYARSQPVAGLKEPRVPPGAIFGLQFTGDGQLLVFADGASLHVLRVPLLSPLWQLNIAAVDHPAGITQVVVARDAHLAAVLAVPLLAAPQEDPKLVRRPGFRTLFRVYDLDTGKTVCEFDVGRDWIVRGLALSPDGRQAALAVRPRQEETKTETDLLLVDATTATIEHQFHTDAAGPIAFAGDHTLRLLVWGKELHTRFHTVDAATGATLGDFAAPEGEAASGLTASRDPRWLAAPLFIASHVLLGELLLDAQNLTPDEVAVWEADSGKIVARVDQVASSAVRLSASGRFLVVGTRIFEFALPENPSSAPH